MAIEGRAEGISQGKFETVRNCLSLNLPIETIVKITGFIREEIKRI